MADTNNNGSSIGNDKFQVLMGEHLKFNSIVDEIYITSRDLSSLVSTVMKQVYADWYGCKFVPIKQMGNALSFLFYFNHDQKADSVIPNACTKDDTTSDNTENSTIRSIRNRNFRLTEGNAYHLTKEGEEGLSGLIFNTESLYTRDHKVAWNRIVSDVADPQSQYMFGSQQSQLTQVTYIDLIKVITMIYGDTDEDGRHYAYNARIVRSLPTMAMGAQQGSGNFMLALEKISTEETEKLARDCGFTFNSGLDIVR